MSILNVNKINPIGGGSTVTIAGIASVTGSVSVGNSITSNEFHGSGANLTGLPAANLTGTIADARFPATLPAVNASNLTNIPAANLTGTLPAISGANLTGLSAGLTMADQHRIPSLFTMATSDTVLTNFERVDSDGAGTLGTGMSVSSGIFTFPSTGIYLIPYFFTPYSNSGSDTNQVQIALQTTTDNGTYGNAAYAVGSLDYQYDRKSIYSTFMFDVTNTSTHKVRFRQYSSGGSIYSLGESVESYNAFTFLRLGDT